jgi:hypothetical protein
MKARAVNQVEAPGLHQVEDDRDPDVEDHEHTGNQHHLRVEDLTLDDAAALTQIEDLPQNRPHRAEETRREPDEGHEADEPDLPTAVDDPLDHLFRKVALRAGASGGTLAEHRYYRVNVAAQLFDRLDARCCRRGFQRQADQGDEDEEEGDGGRDDAEGEAAGQHEDVIVVSPLEDPNDVVFERGP